MVKSDPIEDDQNLLLLAPVGPLAGFGSIEGARLVSSALRFRRQRLGLSARALSEMIEASPSYVSKVESGEIEPSLHAFSRIVTALQLSMFEVGFLVSMAAFGEDGK